MVGLCFARPTLPFASFRNRNYLPAQPAGAVVENRRDRFSDDRFVPSPGRLPTSLCMPLLVAFDLLRNGVQSVLELWQ